MVEGVYYMQTRKAQDNLMKNLHGEATKLS